MSDYSIHSTTLGANCNYSLRGFGEVRFQTLLSGIGFGKTLTNYFKESISNKKATVNF
jgi:hypothetical protein